MSRSINYSASPLLASKTPVWRSKFIVAALAVAFAGLAGRAAYVQVFGNDFFQRQGEVRFARTLELPANRGRILDRNGLLLANSVVAPSIWANTRSAFWSLLVTKTTGMSFISAWRPIFRAVAKPSVPGMLMSINTKSMVSPCSWIISTAF